MLGRVHNTLTIEVKIRGAVTTHHVEDLLLLRVGVQRRLCVLELQSLPQLALNRHREHLNMRAIGR